MNDKDQLRALAEQYGVPAVDLGEVVIQTEDLALIPREVCTAHRILPVLVRGEHLFLAMADPSDKRAVDEIEFVTGKKVYPYVSLSTELTRAIDAAYEARLQRVALYLGPRVSEARRRELGVDARGFPLPEDKSMLARAAPAIVAASFAAPVLPPSAAVAASVLPPRAGVPPVLPPRAGIPPVLPPRAGVPPVVTPLIPPPPADGDDDPPRRIYDEVEETVRRPTTSIPSPDMRGSGGRGGGGPGRLILVVDDEEEIRVMLKRVLLARGHRVIEAESGPVALNMVKQHIPDLLILDAMLPGLHGFDVARRLKASERYSAIPIIMISAVYRGWRVVEDLKASYGIHQYLEKPFRLADVVDAATRALAAPTPAKGEPAADLDTLGADAARALDAGIAAYRAGDVDGAIAILERGSRLDPLAYRLHFHLALLYGKKDRVFDGISELEVALELNPKHFPTLKNLAILYERVGFKNRAIEIWERCVHAAPDPVSRAQVKERLVALL